MTVDRPRRGELGSFLDPHPSPAELRAMAARKGVVLPSSVAPAAAKLAGRPWAPYRSKWEWEYARTYLAVELAGGLITGFDYETERLEIGVGAFYRPDFPVTLPNGRRQMREVKGYKREAAMVRIRAAALRYPEFDFILVTKRGGQWHHETIK